MNKKIYQTVKSLKSQKYKSINPPIYPNEMLVKICSSKNYSKLTDKILTKKIRVCEIGFFAGNNLRFFIDRGCQVFGVEINKFLLNTAKKYLKKFQIKTKPKLFVGDNLNIPIKDNYLDLFVSINTIHYSCGKDIDKALKNFSRVLKKGGIAIIETPAPKHIIFANSKKIKNLEYIFKLPTYNERNGLKIGLFENNHHFKKKILKYFSKVEIKRRTENYNDCTYDFYVAVCKN